MKIVEIKALENGGHRNQSSNHVTVPKGWAVIPDEMETPNFPFGKMVVEEVDGVATVTSWTPGVLPEPSSEPDPELTTEELLNIILGVEE
jgi:hypothetical protein